MEFLFHIFLPSPDSLVHRNFLYECGCFWHIWSPFFLCVSQTSGISMHENEIYPVAGKIELFSWEFLLIVKINMRGKIRFNCGNNTNERERWNLRMMLEGITRQSQNHHQSSPKTTTSAEIHHFHETEFDSISVEHFFPLSASHLKSNFTRRRNKHVEC